MTDVISTQTALNSVFDGFDDFQLSSASSNWELKQLDSGMTVSGPLGGNAAGALPYIQIDSGTTSGTRAVLMHRAIFTGIIDLRFILTASARNANANAVVGLVECDASGNIVVSQNNGGSAVYLNARNYVAARFDGSGATGAAGIDSRSAGSFAQSLAATTFSATTAATGSPPDFIPAGGFLLMSNVSRIQLRGLPKDSVSSGASNALTTVTTQVIPALTKYYRIYFSAYNAAGVTATQWRLHQIYAAQQSRNDVGFRDSGMADANTAIPVNILMAGASSVSQSSLIVSGFAANSASATANPVRVAARTSNVQTTLSNSQTSDLIATLQQALLVHPYTLPELMLQNSIIVAANTAQTLVTAAASLKTMITGIQLSCDTQGAASEIIIRETTGAVILWRHKLQLAAVTVVSIPLVQPLRGTQANTSIEVIIPSWLSGNVYVSIQYYTAT